MTARKPLESTRQAIPAIPVVPSVARPAATVPVERRHSADRHALPHRILSEFGEMPGLSLTIAQAARLFGVPPDITSRILRRLVDERMLRHRRDGRVVIRGEET